MDEQFVNARNAAQIYNTTLGYILGLYRGFFWMLKVALVFCCSLCDWLKNHAPFSRFFLDQSDVKPQEIVTCSHHTGFLALGSSYMYMYLNAIGSFKCLGIFDWPEE